MHMKCKEINNNKRLAMVRQKYKLIPSRAIDEQRRI